MTQQEINELVEKQRNYFLAGNTLNIKDRKNKLKALKKAMKENEIELLDALKNDLGKSHFEGYMCEVGLVYDELNYMIKHIKKFAKFITSDNNSDGVAKVIEKYILYVE